MRVTVRLAPDVEAHVRDILRTTGLNFEQAVNEAIRAGISARRSAPVSYTRPRAMGVPKVNLDNAAHLAAELEDIEIIRKLALGK